MAGASLKADKAARRVLNWYQGLSNRTVDLIGDYAGSELFLVEGDSLILHCLDSRDIDLHNGLQLLHAIYAIESFLAALLQRKANFHIAFFDNHAQHCAPSWSSPEDFQKYQLVRAVLIRHLSVNLPKTHPSVLVHHYETYDDAQFVDYVRRSGLYFFMCHDGASPELITPELPDDGEARKETNSPDSSDSDDTDDSDESEDSDNSDDSEHPLIDNVSEQELAKKVAFRTMVAWCVKHGMNIALTNSVEWQDTKVMSIVLEGSRRNKPPQIEPAKVAQKAKISDGDLKLEGEESQINTIGRNKSEAISVLQHACANLLQAQSASPDQLRTLLLAFALTRQLPLSQRRLPTVHNIKKADGSVLSAFASRVAIILSHPSWSQNMAKQNMDCDLADLIDGRLYHHLRSSAVDSSNAAFSHVSTSDIKDLLDVLSLDPPQEKSESANPANDLQPNDTESEDLVSPETSVLPFQHAVLDEHLASIHIRSSRQEPDLPPSTSRTFRELTHWHNTRPVTVQGKVTLTDWQKARALRSHQMFLRELQQYAASLTSSVGKSLEPEVIFTGQQATEAIAPSSASAGAAKAANAARIASKNEQRFLSAWQSQLKDLEKIKDDRERYVKAQTYLKSLPKDRTGYLAPDIELYMLDCLLRMWAAVCKEGKQNDTRSARFAALIFDTLNQQKSKTESTKAIQSCLQMTADSLGLPLTIPSESAKYDRPLSFSFFLSQVDESLAVPESPLTFQLQHCGPYLDRSFDSAPDNRVRFEPDSWQRRVLDLIDQKKSAFVVAPTSAGKTFISFYAMKQVLRESDDGILVYVAPTKALVNQIAAELQAQYTKKYKYGGKSVWAIHTRDYRINDPQGCQILVTVPHVLQIMLLAPSHAKSSGWSTRVKRIIFDEIHSIGQAEDGVVWEQLLLLAPCPIIALSATVGNPGQFYDWMRSTQEAMGYEMEMVQHPYRYSDLRKFIYQPPKSFDFQPLATDDTVGLPSLDDAPGLLYMHPIVSVINEGRGMPDDLHLEPRDCLSLYMSMHKHSTAEFPLDNSLKPERALPAVVRKVDILKWESDLKKLLKQWMAELGSPFHSVVEDLSLPLRSSSSPKPGDGVGGEVDSSDLLSTTLPLLSALNARNALPAILFNYDRSMCEKICQALMKQLDQAQTAWKASSPKWKAQLEKYAKWKKEQEKIKFKRPTAKKSKGQGDEDMSKGEREREAAEMEQNPFASFDPEGIVEGFSFANNKALLPSEFQDLKRKLEWRHVTPWLIDALKLGIGVHHAGMNRSYRQAVETLFRRGYLRVVIATGTLALGINMPCKTVVFSGDSIFLTALNYRQAAGRAGRRGFDLLGNVVFQNIPIDKVSRLVSSRLPDLNGHFPITTSLVLRLFTLLHDSNESPYAKRAITSLLSQPRLYLGGENFRDQVLHHLRYSIEYLRRQHLIASSGKPINFAGTVSHLYYTENSSFAFHCLLKDGFFNKLCADFVSRGKSEPRILESLMLVMAHLFGRRFCRRADQEFVNEIVKKHSSYVFLPRMPAGAEESLRNHNAETLAVFSTYVKTFAEQHADKLGTDNTLPMTKVQVGGKEADVKVPEGIKTLPPTTVRSAFVALSGHGDKFGSISELCRTARSGVWLEEAAIPHVALYPDDAQMPLNAYLYDFYKHGDVTTLEKANGIRRGDVWFLLNDFSLVLATIVTSFKNYMNVSADADLEMVEVAGGGDMHELDEDDRIATFESAGGKEQAAKKGVPAGPSKVEQTSKVQAPTAAQQKKKTKKVVADSWDDDAEGSDSSVQSDWGGESESEAPTKASTRATSPTTVGAPAWDEDSGEGLRKVALAFEALKRTFDEKFKKMWA
ncbi:DEAD/DEAH box helicase-like protein 4 [Elsinoe fawcettii]|nr:DEAD/DEAH box helicase-like protein 4 [Elsinoe fawcettii]